ncbi:MAG: hypothetical protein GX825_01015 [Syntrophomonadaceae bacterium]|nr:hypothetical protein [Syntrophomonadaceae bacterium]
MKLTAEEDQVAQKVASYFRSPEMSLREKLFNAKLIAVHDLELENFTGQDEKEKLARYYQMLDSIMQKLEA